MTGSVSVSWTQVYGGSFLESGDHLQPGLWTGVTRGVASEDSVYVLRLFFALRVGWGCCVFSVRFGDVQAGKREPRGIAAACGLLGHTGADLGAGLETAGRLERLNNPQESVKSKRRQRFGTSR